MLDEIVLMAQNQQKNDLFLEILNEEVRQKIIDIFQKNNKTLDDKRYLQDILNKLQNIKDNVLNYSNASHAINNVSNVRSIAFNNTNNTIDKIEIIKKSIETFKKNINLLENIIKEVKHSNSPIKATTYSFGNYWDYENNYIEEEWVEKYIDVQSWDNCNLEYFETLKYFSWYNQAMKSMNEWFLS